MGRFPHNPSDAINTNSSQMMRSRQSLQEPSSHPHSPTDEDLESEQNGSDEEVRGREGKGVSTQ